MTTAVAPAEQITLQRGDLAVIPVPEGQVVLRSQNRPDGGGALSVIVLVPHGGGTPHELAKFMPGAALDAADMLTVSLAALSAWR